jgi:hypothetical protein
MISSQPIPGKEPTDIKQYVLDANFYTSPVNGFYRAIVVQNNDPERRGRVKLFIPAFSPHIYEQWLNNDGEYEVKKVRFPQGINLYKKDCNSNEDRPALKQIFESVKDILEWAEQASSLIGEGTSGLLIYDNNLSDSGEERAFATISDASTSERINTSINAQCPAPQQSGDANVDGIGEKGGHKFEIDDAKHDLQDGFVSLNEDKMPEVNANSKIYKPSAYSNRTKGMFTVPNVGAMVWVFFEGGNISKPVYFAYSYDKQDWQSIYDVIVSDDSNNGPDYPGAFENVTSKDVPNNDTSIYRKGKTVLNSKGGSIEIVDTDDYERIKITQAGGSFIQLSNKATIYYADQNEQKLVAGDQFETVNLTKNIRVKKTLNTGVDENRWTRVGTWSSAYQAWVEENRIIADTRARFAIKRAAASAAPSNVSLPPGSIKQERKGTFADNAVLSESTPVVSSPAIQQIYKQTPVASAAAGNQCSTLATATPQVANNESFKTSLSLSPEAFQQAAGSDGANNFSGDPTKSSSSENGSWEPDNEYASINDLETKQAKKMLEFETKFGNGGDDITEITRHKIEIVGAAFNDTPSVRVDAIGRSNFNEVLISGKGAFASQKPSPLVERVANDGKFPCGNYTLVIGNTFSVSSGSGGIKLMSTGCVDVCGSHTVITGANELLLSSSGDINVTSNGKFSVTADIITFRQSSGKQIAIDGSLGVKNNLIVAGGAYIEGELCVNHITAPVEIQETESTIVYGKTVPGKIIGYAPHENGFLTVYGGTPQGQFADDDSIVNVEHSHNFKNLPLTLKQNNEGVRGVAAQMNKGSNQVAASPVRNGMKELS